MKKERYGWKPAMSKGRIAGIAGTAVVCVVLAILGRILSVEKKGTITDSAGTEIAKITYSGQDVSYDCGEGYDSYVRLACQEAAAVIAKQEGVDVSEAFRLLADEEMTVRTSMDPKIAEELLDACKDGEALRFEMAAMESAAAVCDTKGHILACYSHSVSESDRNYVAYPTYAGSTIKPLSVYGPSMENGTVCWSSLYEDSPYNQIINEAGEKVDWPVNTKPFSNTMWTVQEALKKSNNAIAVKVLKDYGVEKSCRFIRDMFGLRTEEEQKTIQEEEEDHVLSNIALGYLEEGITMQELSGAYQTFANGGNYTPMHTVLSIEKKGELYYQEDAKLTQVFSPETAYIMNRMMKTVVEEGGTGESAGVEGLDICGKTGTSNDFKDNWFVGMTPEYVCAVWYELRGGASGNSSAEIFREIVGRLEHDREAAYPKPENVVEEFYCQKTGLLAGEYCKEKGKGYYNKKYMPEVCDCR